MEKIRSLTMERGKFIKIYYIKKDEFLIKGL